MGLCSRSDRLLPRVRARRRLSKCTNDRPPFVVFYQETLALCPWLEVIVTPYKAVSSAEKRFPVDVGKLGAT